MVSILRNSGLTPPVSTAQTSGVGSTSSSAGAVATGTVKWFNAEKGYGFISAADRSDIYVSAKDVAALGQLVEGQQVTYQVAGSPKGPIAVNVRPANPSQPAPIDDDSVPAPAPAPVAINMVDSRSVLANGVQGTVKWFNAESGQGFITADQRGDLYVDVRSLAGLSLESGQAVVFDVVSSPKGPMASNVRLADEE